MTLFFLFLFSLEKQQEKIQPAETAAALPSNRQVWTFPGVIFFSMGFSRGEGGGQSILARASFFLDKGQRRTKARAWSIGGSMRYQQTCFVIIHLSVFLYCMTMDIEEGKAASPRAQVVSTNLMMAQP